MHPQTRTILLTLANLLIPAGILVFAAGFFPYKPFLPGLATHHALAAPVPAPRFDRVVFMVVDALRADFVFGNASGFAYTQRLIRDGSALPFTAHAASPTITMPRVKALTTGSIPSFLDVILNFAESDTSSSLAHQDSWLAQLKAHNGGGRLVMYGDDTWLKLFPGLFARADGTSSFFVSDFTEVDFNVTRHVKRELRNDDWNAFIMHYLGLDHIGHKTGPHGPHMIPKQAEMDGIVQQVHEAMLKEPHLENALFVLCGDHGMNDGGNHGGSAPGETSPALVFISPKLKEISTGRECPTAPKEDFDFYAKIEQSDVVPTLAALLGFPTPLNNLGILIPDFLALWPDAVDRTQLLLRNALQLSNIVKAAHPSPVYANPKAEIACAGDLSSGQELACLWKSTHSAPPSSALEALYKFSRAAQSTMSSAASNYSITLLISGIALSALALGISVCATFSHKALLTPDGVVLALLSVLYAVMMFASSYVEEEQHFWYWSTGAYIAYLGVQNLRSTTPSKSSKSPSKPPRPSPLLPLLTLLALHRLVTRWTQTGVKHTGSPSITTFLTHPAQAPLLSACIVYTYIDTARALSTSLLTTFNPPPFAAWLSALAPTVPALLFRAAFTANDAPELLAWLGPGAVEMLAGLPLVPLARGVFALLAAQALVVLLRRRRGRGAEILPVLRALLTLLLLMQTRATNAPLFVLFRLSFTSLSALLSPARGARRAVKLGIAGLVLGRTAWFAMGSSNAISGVDLSSAYNGVSGYNVLAVGVLVFVGNWAGPIWWAFVCVEGLLESGGRGWVRREWEALGEEGGELGVYMGVLTVFTAGGLAAVQVACTVLRQHLFIWTVFSPKYLYAMAWGLGFHLLVGVLGGLGVWRVGRG
ncbi:alkaline phosphatase-like protein [Trichodelitschia bisporula]|uniref:GPI ethanolamine phosphate transferase 2 n=1 Tax=Trichodelitschia bisporula TaxID=703511 RepID=A0A6G1I7I3_9PEZI|nr:alkaline phosphatase-like protein [Trichodelitschia bisporula]